MFWNKFEQQLNTAFATYVKVEKRVVHSDSMKLRHLVDRVGDDKLAAVSAAILVAICNNPNYSYNDALKSYKATVVKSGTANQSINERQVREQNQGRGGPGRGFGRGSGRGRYSGRRRDGRGYTNYSGNDYQYIPRTIDGSKFLTLSDGTRIEYHPNIHYSTEILNKFSSEERDTLERDKANGTVSLPPRYGGGRGGYGSGRGGYSNKRKIQQLEQQVSDLQSQSQSQDYRQPNQVPDQVDTGSQPGRGQDNRSRISQVTTQEGSIMGGRSDQARQRQQGRGGSRY